ncbi:hypothetical protein [uncultured Methanobrevibacter sp.]|uniref:hypothetical protein n=1 Tax=uncultured Methanobrevibacter sp. TaxID=253161 RepID=UPI0025DDC9FD|nr:hypothetical protein [uncultured Methanobrevibacter sp.]
MIKRYDYLRNILLVMVCFCFIFAMSSACVASDVDNGTVCYENSIKARTNYNERGLDSETLMDEYSIDANTIDTEIEIGDVRNNGDKSNANMLNANGFGANGLNSNGLNSNGLDANELNVIKFNADKTNLKSNNAIGTYDDFVTFFRNLTPGSVIELDKDYNFSSKNYKPLVLDVDDLLINGNNHTIYGNSHDSRIFNITADGVLITDLCFRNLDFTFENTESFIDKGSYVLGYNGAYSPVTVCGDYNEISSCKFIGTGAVNGGAIFWSGDMGKIDSCVFLNCTAKAFGGAIYMRGFHNTVIDSIFYKSISELSQDAIYFASDRKKITIKNCIVDNSTGMFDAKAANFDSELFHYSYMSKVADKEIELNHLLYYSMLDGGIHYLDKDTWYYSEYYNDSMDFILTVFRNITSDGITYSKGYHFNNVHNINDIFSLGLNNSFYLDIGIVKNVYVYDIDSYRSAIKTTFNSLDSIKIY